MIGSTNHLSTLDPAISKRPSRFDRKYHFNIPGFAERVAYCKFWQKKLVGSEMVDFQDGCCEVIAEMTEGFSFAYLKELFVIVLLTIARGGTGDEAEHEEEKREKIEQEEEEKKEESKSEDGHVVVEHADAKAESSDSAEKKEEKPTVPTKVKRVVPEVVIPETLQDNVLLRVVKGQIKMLLDEMDNTDEKDWVSEKKQGGGIPGAKKGRVRRARPC
jgi:transitional endoplasmic reticulum ATPase